MAVKTESPQISALKLAVEKKIGLSIESRSDFVTLSLDIEAVTKEHIGENTLRRLWGKLKGYDTVFKRTVDVLSHYIGYADFKAFCHHLATESAKESAIIRGNTAIRVEELTPGDRILIGWMPDRLCTVEYIGCRTFRAIDAQNATLQAGDTFECSMMLKNYPLFVDNLVHGGEICTRYSIGIENGITTLEKI